MLFRLTTVSVSVIAALSCSPAPTPSPSVVTGPPTQTPELSPPPGVPLPMTDLARQLECDNPGQSIGAEVGHMAPAGGWGTASVDPWLETLTDIDLPLSGFEENPKVPWEDGLANFVRYEYKAASRTKAIIVMTGHSVNGGRGNWVVAAYRACPGAEFDPKDGRTTDNAPWRDASGAIADQVSIIAGPGHCGWQSTTWLHIGNRLYIRDPLGVLAGHTVGPLERNVLLPADARSTGFRSRDRELFIADTDLFVWIKTSQGVERWPRADAQVGCM